MTAAVETVGGHGRAVYVRTVRVESYHDVGNYLAGDRHLRGKYLRGGLYPFHTLVAFIISAPERKTGVIAVFLDHLFGFFCNELSVLFVH